MKEKIESSDSRYSLEALIDLSKSADLVSQKTADQKRQISSIDGDICRPNRGSKQMEEERYK